MINIASLVNGRYRPREAGFLAPSLKIKDPAIPYFSLEDFSSALAAAGLARATGTAALQSGSSAITGVVQPSGKLFADNFAGGASAVTRNMPVNFTQGNDAIITFAHYDGSVTPRITGVTAGGTAGVLDKRQPDGTNENLSEIWRVSNMAGGTSAIVISTDAGAGQFLTFGCEEIEDLAETPLDQTGSATITTSATPTITSPATNTPDQYVYAAFTDYAGTAWTAATPPAGATESWEEPNGTLREAGSAAYKVVSAAGAQSMAFATGAAMSHVGTLVTYRRAIGGRALAYHFTGTVATTLSTPAFKTQPTGSILLACVGRGTASYFNTTGVLNDNKGNGNFPILGTSHAYTSFPQSGTALYAKVAALGGTGHIISTNKPDTADEVTLIAAEFPGVNTIVDHAWVERTSGPTNTSLTVSMDGPGLLAAFWWGTDSNGELLPAVPLDWSLLRHTSSLASNHVQSAVAYKRVTTTGVQNHSITWTPSTSQGAQLYIVAMQQVGASGLAAAGGAQASGTAQLATQINVASAGLVIASGAAAISTSIRAAAVGAGAATGAAALDAKVLFAAAGAGNASGTATLPAQAAQLAASGNAQAAGAAALVAQINMAASGAGNAAGVAALTAGASALAANGLAQATATADLLALIRFAATGGANASGAAALAPGVATLAAAGSAFASATANVLTQINMLATGNAQATGVAALNTSAAQLQAAGAALATASAAMLTQINLNAAGAAQATGGASLTAGSGLAATGSASATGTSDLTTLIRFSATGLAQALASAGLTTQTLMAAAGAGQASGAAQIAIQILLNGAGIAQASGNASLLAGTGLSATGNAQASGAANVATAILLNGFGAAAGAGTAAASTAIRIAASGAGQASGSAGLVAPIALQAVGAAVGNGTGALLASIRMSAAGLAQAIAQGGLTVAIQLAAQGIAQAAGAGLLGDYIPPTANSKYVASRERRSYRVDTVKRDFAVTAKRRFEVLQ